MKFYHILNSDESFQIVLAACSPALMDMFVRNENAGRSSSNFFNNTQLVECFVIVVFLICTSRRFPK